MEERRGKWDFRRGSAGRGARRGRALPVPGRACVIVCACAVRGVCVCACVCSAGCACACAAPGLPLTSSLFRSIREQILARGERPRHTGRSRGAWPLRVPALPLAAAGSAATQPTNPRREHRSYINIINNNQPASHPPVERFHVRDDGRRRCALRRPESPHRPRGPGSKRRGIPAER